MSENVRVAVQVREQGSVWRTVLSLPSFTASERSVTQEAHRLLRRVGICKLADKSVNSLGRAPRT